MVVGTLTRISGHFQGGSVVRLSLGTRSVNILPVAQRTNALTASVQQREHSEYRAVVQLLVLHQAGRKGKDLFWSSCSSLNVLYIQVLRGIYY